MKTAHKIFSEDTLSAGSALLIAVVLTSLLSIIGVLFVMVVRVDRIATSAISENKELNFAIETVVAEISQELVLDVPGEAAEYHDYPGPEDKWLANLEPYESGGGYYWRQISDVTGYLAGTSRDVQAKVVGQYDAIADFNTPFANADADGDGVGDSKWIKLDDITSGKGKPIYAAIRIIDNGGKINVNTAYKFDPSESDITASDIDGSSQLQIDLMALAGRADVPPTPAEEARLLAARANSGFGVDPLDLRGYEENVISDELELNYRFLLNHTDIDTRLEGWSYEFRRATVSTPVTSGGEPLDAWFIRAHDDSGLDPNYAYRHIATAFNMDRIFNPAGLTLNDGKMVNVNIADKNLLYAAIKAGLWDADPNFVGADATAAQIAVNLIDFRDDNANVTAFDPPPARGQVYYGFERPCIYISELACRLVSARSDTYKSYAVELYRPYFEDDDPDSSVWQLVIDGTTIPIAWSGTRRFHVIRFEDPRALTPLLTVNFNDPEEPGSPNPFGYDPSSYLRAPQEPAYTTFDTDSTISLQRRVGRSTTFEVDSVNVPGGWITVDGQAHSIQRDITRHKCIRRLWADTGQASSPTLGQHNTFVHPDLNEVQAHPANRPFTNIGEIGMLFRSDAYNVPAESTEADLRLNLQNPAFANIFQYLTVIDPEDHGWPVYETRIKGRININTAPWFVIARLPWMTPQIARAIVAYRDAVAGGFESTGGLLQVAEMGYYAYDPAYASIDLDRFPDLTPSDGAAGDFEERDVIFSRISNLVTVRSDVFTAYILVRIGVDGPQKRVIAILDRSQVNSTGDKVRIIALHSVPDPR
ncbi:MAG: helix-hairpin-helix domain-containing protein [Planctomycetota bacterium]|jgi:hypothetical protein